MTRIALGATAAAGMAAGMAAAGIAAAGIAAAGIAAAATVSAPYGNQQAITYARSVARAYTHASGLSYTQSGFMALRSAAGTTSFFDLESGVGSVPKGWAAADESATIGLSGGRVSWVRDDLTPIHCDSGCQGVPVELLVTRKGGYWRFDQSGSAACFNTLDGASPFTVGAAWFSVTGGYGALGHRGRSTLARFSFPWSRGRTATETDTISSRTRLLTARRITVAGAAGAPAVTVSAAFTTLARRPAEPSVPLCS